MPQLYDYHMRIPPLCTAITSLEAQHCIHTTDKCKAAVNATVCDWILGQDRPHKYGWYIDSLSGGQLQVTMSITNPNPTVITGYLKSYECRGTVNVYVKGHPGDYNLINSTMAQYSQTYIHRICLKEHLICLDDGAIRETVIDKLATPIQLIIELLPITTAVNIVVPSTNPIHQQKRGLVTVGNITKCIGNRFKIAYIKSCV